MTLRVQCQSQQFDRAAQPCHAASCRVVPHRLIVESPAARRVAARLCRRTPPVAHNATVHRCLSIVCEILNLERALFTISKRNVVLYVADVSDIRMGYHLIGIEIIINNKINKITFLAAIFTKWIVWLWTNEWMALNFSNVFIEWNSLSKENEKTLSKFEQLTMRVVFEEIILSLICKRFKVKWAR